MQIDVNTSELYQYGNDVLERIEKLSTDIDGFFKKIEELNSNWKGEDSDAFIKYALEDKKQYDEFIEELKKMANFLINTASDIDRTSDINKP